MFKIKAIIFDLDGTLADTIESIRAALNNTLRAYSLPERSYDETVAAIGSGARTLIKLSLPEGQREDDALVSAVLAAYHAEYEKTYAEGVALYPGMPEAVASLSGRGYKLAILSNKPDRFVRALTDILFPAGVISYSAGQGRMPMKPDPTVPLLIAHKLDTPPYECAFVGDSDVDILTAKNAGMLAVGCAWGYRGAEVLLNAGADIIIGEPGQLSDIFN